MAAKSEPLKLFQTRVTARVSKAFDQLAERNGETAASMLRKLMICAVEAPMFDEDMIRARFTDLEERIDFLEKTLNALIDDLEELRVRKRR